MKTETSDFYFLGRIIDRSIRTLYMSDRKDFIRIFGDVGGHLWTKFCGMGKVEGTFLCSLDGENQEKFAREVVRKLAEDDNHLS